MPLSANGTFPFDTGAIFTTPVSLRTPWMVMIAAKTPITQSNGDRIGAFNQNVVTTNDGIETADNAAITDPITQIVTDTRRWISRGDKGGTSLILRLVYLTAMTGGPSVTLAVFGRHSSNDIPVRLPTRGANRQVILTANATNDVVNGNYAYTEVVANDHIIDMLGCTEILVGVESALSGAGVKTAAFIQGKII
jgi:hypothetical protein